MIQEIHRVLAPGARYITFSLHAIEEIKDKFINEAFNWKTSFYRVKSSRWNEEENKKRAVAHTMVVCDKPLKNGNYLYTYPLKVDGVLNEEEYLKLALHAEQVFKF
jgi:predicted aldo/keto reductase-like oxidoreductase